MKCVLKTDNVAIFDEVFEKDMFQYFIQYFNGLNFTFISNNQWMKIWRVNDGQILAATEQHLSTKAPFNNPMDWVHHQVHNLAVMHLEDVVGKFGVDWNEISYTPYIYAAGTKISWHDDTGYTAAAIFYCHPEWSPFWGGELMIANTPSLEEIPTEGLNDDVVNRSFCKPLLNYYGTGMYVAPVPNRIAFTKGSVWHAINRVDSAAGDNLRCSVVAFFRKNENIT